MNFPAGVNSKTVYLPVIIDDEVVELTENFTLCFDIEHNSYHLGVVDLDCAQVLISDTDSECCPIHCAHLNTAKTLSISIDFSLSTQSACNTHVQLVVPHCS